MIRLSRRKVMIIADCARAVITFCMLFAQSPETAWLLYVLLFLETSFWALFEPGRSAVIPNITSRPEESMVANALSSVTWSVGLALGSGARRTAGRCLRTEYGIHYQFRVVRRFGAADRGHAFKEPHLENAPPSTLANWPTSRRSRRESVRKARCRLLATMFVKTGTAILGANWIILPIYGERMFPSGMKRKSAGILGMSLLFCSRGIGALIGPLVAGRWSGHNEQRMRSGIMLAFAIARSAT